MAKITLEAGQTSQQQVLEAFGAPNIVTRGSEGVETWTYERVSFDSSYAGGGVGAVGGGGSFIGGVAGASAGSSSSGMRTVTLIIYFDGREIVTDYKVMETHF